MNFAVDFIRFQDSRKLQCQSHDRMKFFMCYLLSGLKKTARNSQNVIKESPPKASQTQKTVSRRGASHPRTPHQGFALDTQAGLSGPLDPLPKLCPHTHTLRSGSGPAHIGSVLFRTSAYTGAKQASRVPFWFRGLSRQNHLVPRHLVPFFRPGHLVPLFGSPRPIFYNGF